MWSHKDSVTTTSFMKEFLIKTRSPPESLLAFLCLVGLGKFIV